MSAVAIPSAAQVLAELRNAAALGRIIVTPELGVYDAVRFRFSAPVPRPHLPVDARLYGIIELSPGGVIASVGLLSVDGSSAAYMTTTTDPRLWFAIYTGEEDSK